MKSSFSAKVEPVPGGGHFVVVPAKIAKASSLRHSARVRGTLNGVRYRSSLMMYSGILHLGVHKATLAEAGVKAPARVALTIELDDEPRPTDEVPQDLVQALKRNGRARAAFEALSPSHKREHVKEVIGAKKPETRARRIDKIVSTLAKAPVR